MPFVALSSLKVRVMVLWSPMPSPLIPPHVELALPDPFCAVMVTLPLASTMAM
jgi:hypothetical protein